MFSLFGQAMSMGVDYAVAVASAAPNDNTLQGVLMGSGTKAEDMEVYANSLRHLKNSGVLQYEGTGNLFGGSQDFEALMQIEGKRAAAASRKVRELEGRAKTLETYANQNKYMSPADVVKFNLPSASKGDMLEEAQRCREQAEDWKNYTIRPGLTAQLDAELGLASPVERAAQAATDREVYNQLKEKAAAAKERERQRQREEKQREWDIKNWEKSVEKAIDENFADDDYIKMLTKTPDVFSVLGIPDLPIYSSVSVLEKVFPLKHEMDPEIIKKLPEKLFDPIMIFKSANKPNSIVVMLETKDEHGSTVIVPIKLSEQSGKYLMHFVTSAYPKNNNATKEPRNDWFINQIKAGNLLYANTAKAEAWANEAGITDQSGSSVSPLAVNPATNTIRTEADLVKLKNKNKPETYSQAALAELERQNAQERAIQETASMQEVRQQYEGTDQWLKAPNGEATNLTEQQWLQVRTPEFKQWFGDWENNPDEASKMLDSNGEPKVFYHNTNSTFSVFDAEKNGSSTDAGWLGDGFYFYGIEGEGAGYGENKMPVYLNIREPYYATGEENSRLAEENSREASIAFREEIEDGGSDGVYYNEDLREETVVFDPAQIKSAIGNTGNFDGANPDIYYQGEADTRAQVDIYKADPNNRKAVVIRIMRGADRSTVPHELAHVFFGEMRDYVMSGQADEATRADFMRLCKWAGPLTVPPDLGPEELEAAQAVGAANIEKVCRAFEQYLAEGRAPSLLNIILATEDFILGLEDGKKRYCDAVSALSAAYALAIPKPEALAHTDEIASPRHKYLHKRNITGIIEQVRQRFS